MQDASSKQQTIKKYKPTQQQAGLPPHSTLPIRGKTNKQKTQHKSHPIWSLYKPLDQAYEGRNLKEEKNQTGSLGNGHLKHTKLKKIMKRQRNTTQMKDHTRNTGVQINEEEIDKIPEKIQNDYSKDDQKPWKQNEENVRIN